MIEKSSRRQLLAGVAAFGFTGCMSSSETGKTSFLAEIDISNRGSNNHSVDVKINWEGEEIYNRSHTVSGNKLNDEKVPGASLEHTWPKKAGQFTVSARLQNQEWKNVDSSKYDDSSCISVLARIETDGTLTMFVSMNEQVCSDL